MAFKVLDGDGNPLNKGSRVRGAGASAEHDDLIAIAAADGTPVDLSALLGATTETAPASDTAASGLNGRLQRVAQRLTTLLGAAGDTPPNLAANASGTLGWLRAIVDRLPLIGGSLATTLRDASGTAIGTAGNPLITSPVSNSITLTDRSGTIAVGGTQQTLAAANSSRRGLWVQNNSNGDLRINSTGNASATVGLVLPGGQNALYEYPTNGVPVTAISIWGATTGQAFEAREW